MGCHQGKQKDRPSFTEGEGVLGDLLHTKIRQELCLEGLPVAVLPIAYPKPAKLMPNSGLSEVGVRRVVVNHLGSFTARNSLRPQWQSVVERLRTS